jgi:hypothetical protein
MEEGSWTGSIPYDTTTTPCCALISIRFDRQISNTNYLDIIVWLQRDTRRSNFGLKEKKLAAAFVKAMQLRDTSDDAIKLTGWRVPTIDKVTSLFALSFLLIAHAPPSSYYRPTLEISRKFHRSCLD